MGSSSSTCNICFESKSQYITCDLNHVVCKLCLSSYVQSCCEDIGRLKDNGNTIRCPELRCTAKAWSTKSLKHNVDKTIYKLFESTLEQSMQSNMPTKSEEVLVIPASLTISIVDCLNISCPKCENVLDQTPDGCCAIRCNRCAVYFCWLCFEVSLNSATCHAHVSSCKYNSVRREPFVPQSSVDAAHRAYRLQKIRAVLQTFCQFNDSEQWNTNKFVRRAVKDTEALLKMNHITIDDVLTSR
jgi:hypothetical protein